MFAPTVPPPPTSRHVRRQAAWRGRSRPNAPLRHTVGRRSGISSGPRDRTASRAAIATPTGGSSWLVGRDGGVFAFGNATYHGSIPATGITLTPGHRIVAAIATPTGGGYLLIGRDGGVFAFGNAAYHGSIPATGITLTPGHRIVAAIAGGGASPPVTTAAGGSPPGPVPPTFGTTLFGPSSLAVSITELPPGTPASVDVSGPGGYHTGLTATRTLADVPPGTYHVTAAPVTAGTTTYYPSVTGSPATVSPGSTVTVTVSYLDEVPSTTKTMTAGDAADLTTVSSTSLTFTSASGLPSSLANLAVGDVVVFGVTPETPFGLLRTITSVAATTGHLVLGTEPATLTDAVPRGNLSVAEPLADSSIMGSVSTAPGVTVLPGAGPGPAAHLRAGHHTPSVGPGSGDLGLQIGNQAVSCGAGAGISVSGTVYFAPSVNFSASWSLLSGANLNMSASMSTQAQLQASAQEAVGCSATLPLGSEIEFDPIDVQVGPIPVVIEPQMQIQLVVSVNGEVSQPWATADGETATVSAGLSYSGGGFSPESSFTLSPQSLASPSVSEGSVSIQVAVGPQLQLLIYDVVGPEFNLYGFTALGVSPSSTPWWTLKAGVEGGAGIVFNPGGLGIINVSYDDPSIISEAIAIAQAPAGQSAPPPVFTTTSLPAATVGIAYGPGGGGVPVSVTSGAPPYTWSAPSGSLPPGMSLDSSTGLLSGTPTKPGTYSIPVTVADSIASTPGHTITTTFTVAVAGPTITTTTLPFSEYGRPYSDTMDAVGGVAPLTWSVPTNVLPPGLSFDPTTGVISGTPTIDQYDQVTPTFTVTDADGNTASATLTLTNEGSPAIYDQGFGNLIPPTYKPVTDVPGANDVGAPYDAAWVANEYAGVPPFRWSLSSGSLPPGVSGPTCEDPAQGCLNATAAGTPTQAGTYTFTIELTDALGGTSTQTDTVTVNPRPAITTPSLPDATSSTPYSTPVQLSGGTGPYTWSVSGSDTANLALSGTSTTATLSTSSQRLTLAAGTYPLTITAEDHLGIVTSVTVDLVVKPLPALVISPASLHGADQGVSYSVTITGGGGGGGPYTLSSAREGFPVSGISVSAGRGTIHFTGTPTTAGQSVTYAVTVNDVYGNSATFHDTLTVNPPPKITTTTLPDATFGAAYNQTLAMSGGTAPAAWSVSAGTLPAGLTLNPTTGAITGTLAPDATDVSFTATVTDAAGGTATAQLAIDVPLTIETATVPAADQGVPYDTILQAGGGVAPYTWTLAAGSTLPGGLTGPTCADPTCTTATIAGSPTNAGKTTFTVQVSDSEATPATASQTYTLTVEPPPSIPPGDQTLPDSEVGVFYARQLTVTGGVAPYVWTGSGLPSGLSLGSDGVVAGTPTGNIFLEQCTPQQGCRQIEIIGVGTFHVDASVTDATGTTFGPFTLTITVVPAVAVSSTLSCSSPASLATGALRPQFLVSEPFCPGEVGLSFSQQFSATGGDPPYHWSLFLPSSGDHVPPGLSLSSSGLLSGTPQVAGFYAYGIEVTDAAGGSAHLVACNCDGEQQAIYSPPSIETASLPSVEVGAPYSTNLVLLGGGPASAHPWSVVAGALPPGLTLAAGYHTISGALTQVGIISGVPTQVGTFSFTVQFEDDLGGTARQALTIDVVAGPLAITTTSLPNGYVDEAYGAGSPGTVFGTTAGPVRVAASSTHDPRAHVQTTGGGSTGVTLHADGGTPPYTWAVSGLPPGITLDSSTGVLSGTPTKAGSYTVTVTVTDAADDTATAKLTLTVYSQA